ncbi:MAG: hypothetical protein PHC92_04680 [Syntrophomonadaceae bacterium]|nr:hypothetical protein [Syntrophomonadaceae bacterium]
MWSFSPVPEDEELDEWHEWNLKTSKSINAIIKYLWNDISKENKEKSRELIEHYIKIKFVPVEIVRKILRNSEMLVVIGFDVLQVPKYVIIYEFE